MSFVGFLAIQSYQSVRQILSWRDFEYDAMASAADMTVCQLTRSLDAVLPVLILGQGKYLVGWHRKRRVVVVHRVHAVQLALDYNDNVVVVVDSGRSVDRSWSTGLRP